MYYPLYNCFLPPNKMSLTDIREMREGHKE